MKNILEVSHLTKYFDDQVAVNDVSLKVKMGESLGIIGLNGSGRSTLLKLILAIIKPDSGEITIKGDRISSINKPKSSQVGSFLETPALFPLMTGLDHLRLQIASSENELIDEIIEDLDLGKFVLKPVQDISYSMKQRLAIAQALVSHAPLVFLDEPTTGLTVSEVERLQQVILKRMSQGTSFVITGKKAQEVQPLTENLIFLHEGRVISKKTSKQHPTVILETSDNVLARAVLIENKAPLSNSPQLIINPTDDFSLTKMVTLLTKSGLNIYRLEAIH